MDYADDTPKYRKRAKKGGKPKADHKHAYTWCVFGFHGIHLSGKHGFVPDEETTFTIGTYCPVCGKIGLHSTSDPRWYKQLDYYPRKTEWRDIYTERALREFDPGTRTLPYFFLDDHWFQKYVDIKE